MKDNMTIKQQKIPSWAYWWITQHQGIIIDTPFIMLTGAKLEEIQQLTSCQLQ
jgi:hypothetical protein